MGVGLQAGVVPTGQAICGCRHEAAPPDVERVVVGVGLQRDRSLGVPDRGAGSPRVGAEGGGGGEARQLRQLRGGRRVEDLFGPTGGFEESLGAHPSGWCGRRSRRGDQVGLVGGQRNPAQVGDSPSTQSSDTLVRSVHGEMGDRLGSEVTGVTVTHLGDRPSSNELVFANCRIVSNHT
jgi:hypothetical protein